MGARREYRADAGPGRAGPIIGLLLALAGCGPADPPDGDGPDFERDNRQWRQGRLERLTMPYGWLSLTGLHTLAPGRHRLGSGADNDIVLSGGPARWGALAVEPGSRRVEFIAAEAAGVTLDGAPVGRVVLRPGEDPPTLEAGGVRIHLVEPGGRLALRVRDPQAPPRTGFAGLDYYPLAPEWRVEADFIAHPEGTTMQVANVMGQLIAEPNPGRVEFVRDGQAISLEAVREDDKLFFVFADRTSGTETYGLGRMLYADLPDNGKVVLDFNQAYNPPCAFNAFTTCPLPPQANRVEAWIRAGERKYTGPPGLDEPRAVPQG